MLTVTGHSFTPRSYTRPACFGTTDSTSTVPHLPGYVYNLNTLQLALDFLQHHPNHPNAMHVLRRLILGKDNNTVFSQLASATDSQEIKAIVKAIADLMAKIEDTWPEPNYSAKSNPIPLGITAVTTALGGQQDRLVLRGTPVSEVLNETARILSHYVNLYPDLLLSGAPSVKQFIHRMAQLFKAVDEKLPAAQ